MLDKLLRCVSRRYREAVEENRALKSENDFLKRTFYHEVCVSLRHREKIISMLEAVIEMDAQRNTRNKGGLLKMIHGLLKRCNEDLSKGRSRKKIIAKKYAFKENE